MVDHSVTFRSFFCDSGDSPPETVRFDLHDEVASPELSGPYPMGKAHYPVVDQLRLDAPHIIRVTCLDDPRFLSDPTSGRYGSRPLRAGTPAHGTGWYALPMGKWIVWITWKAA